MEDWEKKVVQSGALDASFSKQRWMIKCLNAFNQLANQNTNKQILINCP